MLVNILLCVGQSHTTKNDLGHNVRAQGEKRWHTTTPDPEKGSCECSLSE